MASALVLKVRIQIYCGDEIAMGPGKADLLEAIIREGSISGAGRAMDMSYRRAWLLVDAMNRCWQQPLVKTSPGSNRGGGASVTEMGLKVLAHYRSLQARLGEVTDCSDRKALAEIMLPTPRISQKS